MVLKHTYSQHWIFSLAGNYFKKISWFLLPTIIVSQDVLPRNALADELGCGNCHSGVNQSEIISNRAPDLSYAGVRYNESFLFDYLKSPKKVRQHVGDSRMPNYNFSDDEALALTQYLMTRNFLPKNRRISSIKIKNNTKGLELIHTELQCTACHTLNDLGQAKSTDLTEAGVRLQSNWLYDLILKPSVYVPRESPMPSFFFAKLLADLVAEPLENKGGKVTPKVSCLDVVFVVDLLALKDSLRVTVSISPTFLALLSLAKKPELFSLYIEPSIVLSSSMKDIS